MRKFRVLKNRKINLRKWDNCFFKGINWETEKEIKNSILKDFPGINFRNWQNHFSRKLAFANLIKIKSPNRETFSFQSVKGMWMRMKTYTDRISIHGSRTRWWKRHRNHSLWNNKNVYTGYAWCMSTEIFETYENLQLTRFFVES